jgi:hypothetical protein
MLVTENALESRAIIPSWTWDMLEREAHPESWARTAKV